MDNELDETGLTPETEEPVVESSPTEQAEESTSKKEIMIPKKRFDEVNNELKELRSQPKPKVEKTNIDEIIDQKLAPLKVQIETESVLRKYDDFEQFASGALTQIKKNPSLSLEDAYKLVKYDHLQSKAKEEGKKEAYQTIEKKESLQFETSGPKKGTRSIDDMIHDKSVSIEELAKMLPRS